MLVTRTRSHERIVKVLYTQRLCGECDSRLANGFTAQVSLLILNLSLMLNLVAQVGRYIQLLPGILVGDVGEGVDGILVLGRDLINSGCEE